MCVDRCWERSSLPTWLVGHQEQETNQEVVSEDVPSHPGHGGDEWWGFRFSCVMSSETGKAQLTSMEYFQNKTPSDKGDAGEKDM